MNNNDLCDLKKSTFTPIMPDGFIGKPWDNYYVLKDFSFENGLCFSFSDNIYLVCDKSSYYFRVFNSIFIIINNSAKLYFKLTPNFNKEYKKGVISLIFDEEDFCYKLAKLHNEINKIFLEE